MTDPQLLPQILAALDAQNPDQAAQLRAELGQSTEPAKPATLLDELRAEETAGLSVSEIPNPHELPLLVGLLVEEHRALSDRVAELEGSQPSPAKSPDGASQVVKPAPDEPESATPAPAPAAPEGVQSAPGAPAVGPDENTDLTGPATS